MDLNISGDEAFNRRARLSGRAVSPPRAPSPPPPVDDDIDGEELEMPTPSPAPTAAPPVQATPKENFAARMMAKMGWKEGSGLGKEEQGMTTALVHKKTDRNSGIIVNAPPISQNKPSAKLAARFPPTDEQSKILLLKNMVGPGEVDDDLESETASECAKYGEVVVSSIYAILKFEGDRRFFRLTH